MSFKWVHISDIHYKVNNEDFINEQRKSKLIDKLNTLHNVDALILSGDFRYAPSGGNVSATVKYILSLAQSLKIKEDQIFCVPGNHDLDRDDLRTFCLEGVSKTYTPDKGNISEKPLKELTNGFSFYVEIEKAIHDGKSLFTENNGLHYTLKLNNCNLVLLNTALLAGTDSDQRALIIGMHYLKSAIQSINKKKPTILIGHHGLSFLEPEEHKAVKFFLADNNINLYLCGHEHASWYEDWGKGIHQFTAGCVDKDKGEGGFFEGELTDSGQANIYLHKWLEMNKNWEKIETPFTIPLTCKETLSEHITIENEVEKVDHPFTLDGHILLGGRGREGIKYFWRNNENLVESVAFNKRLCEDAEENITDEERHIASTTSAYTISTSFGCMLAASNKQCRFCDTGTLNFKRNLTAEEIALQCIFMASYDANCLSFPAVRMHKREFAFMGQGEPGYNYPAIKRAIKLTDWAMKKQGQSVYRYIISTCGISEFIPSLISDIENDCYENRISLHLSLHQIKPRRIEIMPIESLFPYSNFLEQCKRFKNVADKKFGGNEKIGVGILHFKGFYPKFKDSEPFAPLTLTQPEFNKILKELDNDTFKIDLCDLNNTSIIAKQITPSNEETKILINTAKGLGFDIKPFASFGNSRDLSSGCGMLHSQFDKVDPDGNTTKAEFNKAVALLKEAIAANRN